MKKEAGKVGKNIGGVEASKFFIDEMEIIVEIFALVKFKEGFLRHLLMPWRINFILFHGRKDMNQSFSFLMISWIQLSLWKARNLTIYSVKSEKYKNVVRK